MMNKKKWLSMILACCMVVGMLPTALATEVSNKVAKVDQTEYDTLQEAIDAAEGKQITLLSNVNLTEDATWTNVKINCATYRIQVQRDATLTINGDETEFTNSEGSKAALLRAVGTLNINGGTYTSNYIEPIVIWGTANIAGGTFKSTVTTTKDNKFDGQGVIVVNGRDGGDKCPGTLNMTGGTIIVDDNGNVPGYAMHGLTIFNDGSVTLGEKGGDGPTIQGKYCAIGMNNLYGPIALTINSGTYSCNDASGDEKFNANIYMSAASNITIKGGTFTAATGTSNTPSAYVFSVPYNDANVTLNIEGGEFKASGNQTVFRSEDKQTTAGGNNTGKPSVTVTGGTFTDDTANKYVPKTHHVVKNSETEYVVKEGAEVFTAELDTRGNSNISVTPFTVSKDDPTVFEATVSGNVDMRTYVVADTVLQADFASLLADARTPANATLLAAIENKYVKSPLKLVFADIEFLTYLGENLGKEATDYYFIQQTNEGMGYAYTTADVDGPKGGVKNSLCKGDRDLFKDGLTFLLYDKNATTEDDIVFKIAPCDQTTQSLPTEKVTTFIIHNNITFTESKKPADADPVVEVTPDVTDKTATATVPGNAVTNEKVAAAAGTTDKTLVIDAGGDMSGDIKKTEITLEAGVVTALADESAEDITTEIKTPVGTVSLPAEAAKQISDGAEGGNVKLVVDQSGPVPTGATASFVVSVEKAGSGTVPVENLAEPIVLSFNIGKGLADQHPQLFYKAKDGTLETIPSSYDNDTGILTGKTTHLSEFLRVDTPAVDGGLGKVLTITPTKGSGASWITVQVTKGGSNAIYSIQQNGPVTISAPINSTVTVWETSARPDFDNSGAVSNGVTVYFTKTAEKI